MRRLIGMTIEKQREDEKSLSKFIIKEYLNDKTNMVRVFKQDLEDISILEKDASRILLTWASDCFIKIITKSRDDSFSMPWIIEVNSIGLKYFENNQ